VKEPAVASLICCTLLAFPWPYYENREKDGSRGFQLNQPTRCSNFSSLLLVISIQLNMFRASSCPSSGATTTTVTASGLLSELGDSSAAGDGRAGCGSRGP